MRYIMLTTAALSMALAAPALAQGQGNDKGGKPAATAQKGGGNSGKKGNSGKPDKAQKRGGGNDRADNGNRGGPPMRATGNPGNGNRGNGNGAADNRGNGNASRAPAARNGNGANGRDARYADDRRDTRRGSGADIFYVRDDGRFRFDNDRAYNRSRDYYAISDCPPGLAKKNNGCLPPGQAKKLYNGRDSYLGYYPRYRGENFYYSNGYAYRYDRGDSLINAFLPMIGGALFEGNRWPTSYDSYTVPAYYQDYYGYNDRYNYRYADRTIFAVDPETQAIAGIAGLLTGNDFAVGQPVPSGYDVYNVPYGYRDRYADGPDSYYRYSDGYVYQADPKTRLITAAIELVI